LFTVRRVHVCNSGSILEPRIDEGDVRYGADILLQSCHNVGEQIILLALGHRIDATRSGSIFAVHDTGAAKRRQFGALWLPTRLLRLQHVQ